MSTSDYETRLKKTKRNDPCPCGSGKKYKKCHLADDEAAQHAAGKAVEAAEEAAAAAEAEAAEENTEEGADAEATAFVPKERGPKQHFKGQKGQGGRTVNLPRRSGKG
ncbi:MAG: hypothetical protein HOH43_11925 [Candidatus Latescibacteria bacterium]|jgi:hypothetical protein|nr:hypothetical protein [Candidatus Latescibacterota bacterium]